MPAPAGGGDPAAPADDRTGRAHALCSAEHRPVGGAGGDPAGASCRGAPLSAAYRTNRGSPRARSGVGARIANRCQAEMRSHARERTWLRVPVRPARLPPFLPPLGGLHTTQLQEQDRMKYEATAMHRSAWTANDKEATHGKATWTRRGRHLPARERWQVVCIGRSGVREWQTPAESHLW